MNRPEVQEALHANTTVLPWRWSDCRSVILAMVFIFVVPTLAGGKSVLPS